MKKLSIALALILCLVMVVFCFASCGKKKATNATTGESTIPASSADSTTPGSSAQATTASPTTPEGTKNPDTTAPDTTAPDTTAPDTTAPDTTAPDTTAPEPEHQHTQGADYVIDTPASCGADGQKSYHCTECGEIIPGTEVVIPADPTLHVVTDWTVTEEASVLGDGTREGICTVCSQPVEEAITFQPSVYDANSAGVDWKIKKNLVEALDGEHLYPTEENPNGKDLYFQVDFLWNETITTKWADGDGMRIELVNADSTRDNLFLFVPKNDKWGSSDAKAPGGFDYGWIANHEIVYGPKGVNGTGTNAENFPNIGEYGWHRIGVQVHWEAETEGESAVAYSMVTTLYLDGVKAWQISFVENSKNFDSWATKGIMPFTATNNAGVLEYADPADTLALDFSAYHTAEMADLILVYGNAFLTAVDPDFEPDVVPVANPAEASITPVEGGAELDAKVWFRLDDGTCTDHIWNGEIEVTKKATLLEAGTRIEHCSICGEPREVNYDFEPDIQKFTDSTKNSYNPNIAKVSDIRGDEHFYTAGNDLLVEFSILWTEEIKDLRVDKKPYMDVRFTQTSNPDSTNKNIIYWSITDNCPGSDCAFAGGFEWGGIDQNEPDNPYPKFTDGALGLGETRNEYPNIGGLNGGDGTEQGEDRYGWHRVSVRYRQEVSNVDAVKAGSAAEYKLSLWVYIDGVLVVHSYATDFVYKPGESGEKDYKLFTAASDGNGGIAYTDSGDDLYLSGAYFHYKQMASGKVAYFAIADYSAKIGSEFEQNVARLDDPVEAQYEVEDGVFVPATIWYVIPCAEHTWDGEFTVTEVATLLNDGEKVEHCSVCGVSHKVDVPFELSVYDSKNPAGPYATDTSFAFNKKFSDIRGDKSFAPTEDDPDGNDLWFEYSFLWNDSLQYRDNPSNFAELRIFGFRDMVGWSNYRGFYYLYTLDDDGKGGAFHTSNDCPFAGHIDYSTYKSDSLGKNNADDLSSLGNTLNGKLIGRYAAGWDGLRESAPYLYDSEWQTMGGWHRLGFRYHQEATIDGGAVKYAAYTELYIDGVLCWRVHSDTNTLKNKNLLLWTATIDPEDDTKLVYTENEKAGVEFRIDNITSSSQSVFIAVDDIQTNCGDGFVHPVVRVENPKPVTIQLPDGNDYDGAMYFTYAHSHVWDEDYEVVEAATLLSEGVKADHCSICGETHESVIDETDPIIISSNMDTAARTAFNTANGVDWLNHPDLSKGIMIKRSINDIKGADQHYYPTEGNAQGNDLLVEVSFLWNETLANTYTWEALTFGHVDGYDVFNVDSKIHPKERDGYTYEFLTPTPAEIAENAALKTPSTGEYGWHRLGFRVHQEAAIEADAVKYTYIASVYVDGVLLVSYDATDYVVRRNPTGTVTALLYTAEIDAEDNTKLNYFDIGDDKAQSTYKTSYGLIFFEDFFKKSNGYCVIGDLSMTCGHDFVQDVEAVADPAAATFEVADGVEVPAAFYYKLAD